MANAKKLIVLVAPDRHGKTTVLRLIKGHLGKRARCVEWAQPDESQASPFCRFGAELDSLLASRASYGVWGRSWLDTLFYEDYFTHRQLHVRGYESLLDSLMMALADSSLELTFVTVGRPLELVDKALRQEQLARNPSISPWFLEQNVRAAQLEAGLFAEYLSSSYRALPELFPQASFVHIDNSGNLTHLEHQVLDLLKLPHSLAGS